MRDALASINRRCIELANSREEREVAEKREKEETKKMIEDEKKADAEFVKVMSRNKKKPVVIQLGFMGLKEQVIERRMGSDKQYMERCDAFEVLADKDKLGETLKFTSLCKSVTTGKKCYHKKCRFAHKIEDLAQKEL